MPEYYTSTVITIITTIIIIPKIERKGGNTHTHTDTHTHTFLDPISTSSYSATALFLLLSYGKTS